MMVVLHVVFLAALAGISVSAEPVPVFPEVAREFAGSRIVSGWEAEEGQLPYQLSMRMVNSVGQVNACGGTIIHAEWGLTAAHCTADRITMVLRAGTVNLTQPGLIFETTEYYNHPAYDASIPSIVQPNDIALLKFNRVLTFNDNIQPIRLQPSKDKDRNYSGVRMVASGWGRSWTGGSTPENLNWVFLSGVSNLVCFLAYGGSPIIQDSTICAAYYNVTSQSVCQGDSGGPLVITDDDGSLTQVGVTSFVSGAGCHTEHPAGFIRPGHYQNWIQEVTGIDFDWEPEESEETESGESSSSEESSSSSSSESSEESGEESTTAGPEEETTGTTEAPEEETVGTATPAPEEETEGTTTAPEEETVGTATPAPEEETEGTTETPEEETVGTATPAPEEETEGTTETPEEETVGTTEAPEEETVGTSTAAPEEETEGTPEAPEEETVGTTEVPEEETVGTSTAAPEEETEGTTEAPEEETVGTTEAPEEETVGTSTAAPEEATEGTTVGTSEEENKVEIEEAGNNFIYHYFRHFW